MSMFIKWGVKRNLRTLKNVTNWLIRGLSVKEADAFRYSALPNRDLSWLDEERSRVYAEVERKRALTMNKLAALGSPAVPFLKAAIQDAEDEPIVKQAIEEALEKITGKA